MRQPDAVSGFGSGERLSVGEQRESVSLGSPPLFVKMREKAGRDEVHQLDL